MLGEPLGLVPAAGRGSGGGAHGLMNNQSPWERGLLSGGGPCGDPPAPPSLPRDVSLLQAEPGTCHLTHLAGHYPMSSRWLGGSGCPCLLLVLAEKARTTIRLGAGAAQTWSSGEEQWAREERWSRGAVGGSGVWAEGCLLCLAN